MSLSPAARLVLVALASLLAFALVLALKARHLDVYLQAPLVGGAAAFALVALLTWGAARALRAGREGAAMVLAVALVVLFVDLMVTPLPYEIAGVAQDFFRGPKENLFPPVVFTARSFERGHPVASIVFRYPPEEPLPTLANATFAAFEARGWDASWSRRAMGDGPNDFAIVVAARGPFGAHCVLGTRSDFADHDGAVRSVSCTVTV